MVKKPYGGATEHYIYNAGYLWGQVSGVPEGFTQQFEKIGSQKND